MKPSELMYGHDGIFECTLLIDPVRRFYKESYEDGVFRVDLSEPTQEIPVGLAKEMSSEGLMSIHCSGSGGQMVCNSLAPAFVMDSDQKIVYKSALAALICRDLLNSAEIDQNAAMIARDEPVRQEEPAEFTVPRSCVREWFPLHISTGAADWPFGAKSSAKPAIHGITTVHDGKARGIGFCSE